MDGYADSGRNDALVDGVFHQLTRSGDVVYRDATQIRRRLRVVFEESSSLRAAAQELLRMPEGYAESLEDQQPLEREKSLRALQLEEKIMEAVGLPIVVIAREPRSTVRTRRWLHKIGVTWLGWYRRRTGDHAA